jgi:hypothetical protein
MKKQSEGGLIGRAVFISHASKNSRLADEIRRLLEERGLSCWIAPRDIPAGKSYGEQIAIAIEQCRVLVLVMTEQANHSRAVANELELAFRHQRLIIPVRIKEVEPARSLQFYISNAQWVDACHTPLKIRVEEIALIVRAAISGDSIPVPSREHKTLIGSLERFLENAIRYKMLTATIAVGAILLIGSASAFFVSDTLLRLVREQTKIDADPATLGLITLAPTDEPPGESTFLSLRGSIFVNLRDPAKAGIKLIARAYSQSGSVYDIDLSGAKPFSAPGAQVLYIQVPASTSFIRFCMAAKHPTLTGRYVAVWAYRIEALQEGVSVERSEEPRLLGPTDSDCLLADQELREATRENVFM